MALNHSKDSFSTPGNRLKTAPAPAPMMVSPWRTYVVQ